MKRSISIVSSFFCIVAFLGLAFAGMGGQSLNIKVKKHITGNVTVIDTSAMTITIKQKIKINDKDVQRVFKFNNNTNVMMGTEKKTINDVKNGDQVTITYIKIDGDQVAETISKE